MTLFTFAMIASFQEIFYLGEDLVECLAKTVCITKPIIDYFTLENMRKCMGLMQLRSMDLLSDVWGPTMLAKSPWDIFKKL